MSKLQLIFIIGLLLQFSKVRGQENNLFVAHLTDDKIEIIEIDSNHTTKTIYSNINKRLLPYFAHNNYIMFADSGISLYNLNSKLFENIENTNSCIAGGFIPEKNWIFYTREIKPGEVFQIELYDFEKKKIIKKLPGYSPNYSINDGLLYYLNYETLNNNGKQQNQIFIYSYDTKTDKESKRTSIELDDYDRYDVTEVIGFSANLYVYRIYDEHEYRYYYLEDKKELEFYSGNESHHTTGQSKEQYSLNFSNDGTTAVFTERNWNELTYIVTVDLKNKKRTVTDYFGSFPIIKNNQAYFVSDPEFVKSHNRNFRQINKYALYSYDLKTTQLKEIMQFKGGIQIIK